MRPRPVLCLSCALTFSWHLHQTLSQGPASNQSTKVPLRHGNSRPQHHSTHCLSTAQMFLLSFNCYTRVYTRPPTNAAPKRHQNASPRSFQAPKAIQTPLVILCNRLDAKTKEKANPTRPSAPSITAPRPHRPNGSKLTERSAISLSTDSLPIVLNQNQQLYRFSTPSRQLVYHQKKKPIEFRLAICICTLGTLATYRVAVLAIFVHSPRDPLHVPLFKK